MRCLFWLCKHIWSSRCNDFKSLICLWVVSTCIYIDELVGSCGIYCLFIFHAVPRRLCSSTESYWNVFGVSTSHFAVIIKNCVSSNKYYFRFRVAILTMNCCKPVQCPREFNSTPQPLLLCVHPLIKNCHHRITRCHRNAEQALVTWVALIIAQTGVIISTNIHSVHS